MRWPSVGVGWRLKRWHFNTNIYHCLFLALEGISYIQWTATFFKDSLICLSMLYLLTFRLQQILLQNVVVYVLDYLCAGHPSNNSYSLIKVETEIKWKRMIFICVQQKITSHTANERLFIIWTHGLCCESGLSQLLSVFWGECGCNFTPIPESDALQRQHLWTCSLIKTSD